MENFEDKSALSILNSIAERSEETKDLVQALDKKVDLHIQRTQLEFERINELDARQNELLDKHIEGVNTLKKWCDSHERANEKRLSKLEAPRKWLQMTKDGLLWISAVAGAILVLAKFLHFF